MNDQSLLRKKLVQFYLMFYLVMFFSLFYVMKFYFEKPYIFFAVIFTWIPQIIFNMIYKNRMSLPIMNILLTSLNKVFLPFYFRGCPQNFFQLKTDFYFVMGCTICLLIEVKNKKSLLKIIFLNIFKFSFYLDNVLILTNSLRSSLVPPSLLLSTWFQFLQIKK